MSSRTAPTILRHTDTDTDDETRYVDSIPPSADDAAYRAATPVQVARAQAEASMPSAQDVAARALPAVLRQTAGEGALRVGGFDLSLSGLTAGQSDALRSRAAMLGMSEGASARVSGQIAGDALPADIAKPGGYRLTIATDGARVEAFDAAGLYYAVEMLLSFAPAGAV